MMERKKGGTGGTEPFDLFCQYYLGLTPEGGYRFSNANKIAARLKWSVGKLMQTLREHGLHPDTVVHTDFPLARYQADFQIAAESESKEWLVAFAGKIYEDFRRSGGKRRNWLAEIEQEQQQDQDEGSS